MSQPQNRHVAVLIETDDSWGRNVVESIARHAQLARWTLLIAPRDGQRRLRLPRGWKGDGIVVSLRDKSLARHVKEFRLPAVDVSIMLPKEEWLGRVATDDRLRAQLAFDHFKQRGYSHFGCYAPPIGRYSNHRADEFRRVVEGAGYACSVFPTSARRGGSGWLSDYRRVSKWLAEMPRPLAVFASDPYPARQLAEICQLTAIHIPNEVAVLSGDDDELLCNAAWPQISSVELASHRIGKEACQLLEEMWRGKPVRTKPILLRPLGVRERHSTEVLAVADPELAEILRYIRSLANEGIQVSDLLRVFAVSRRTLELRFRQVLNRSPAEEIRRVRLEHARTLFLETDKSISSVAHASGFADGATLSHAFRKQFGISPGELRAARPKR